MQGARAGAVLFVINVNGEAATMCASGHYTEFMLFVGFPLMVGPVFGPRWWAHALMCAAHAARPIFVLGGLGTMVPFLVIVASVLGAVLRFMQERHFREHFVSGP